VITNPNWERLPTDLDRYFPERAQRLNMVGHTVMRCTVTARGTLTACQILSEDPADFGFGEAALRASVQFKMRPKTKDGAPVDGGQVTIPMKWTLPKD
jgi:protein TonB